MTDIPEDEILLARMHAAYQQSFVGQMPTEEMKAELRAEGKLYGRLLCYLADRAAQAERMARLEEALKFYADPDIYERRQIGGTFIKPMAMIDKGESARRALSQEGSEPS